jgi:hypothetical protein
MELGEDARSDAEFIVQIQENVENTENLIGHKDFIRLIRDYM